MADQQKPPGAQQEWTDAQRKAIAAAFEKSGSPACPVDQTPLASTRTREIGRWEILFRCPTCNRQYRYPMKMGM